MVSEQLEQEIQTKANVAPRVTLADLNKSVSATFHFNLFEALVATGKYPYVPEAFKLTTICALDMVNGFTVLGESACASPENYNREIGEKIATDRAKEKLWPLLGYQLKSSLAK